MEIKLTLTSREHKDLISYCNLNDLLISEVVKKSFTTGFNIERYGLLNSNTPKETIVEKIVEVPVEKIVTKVEYISDDSKMNELFEKIEQLKIEKEWVILNSEKKDRELDELRRSLDKPPVEKIVEVVVEKEITDNSSKVKIDALQTTLGKIREESLEKDKKILSLEDKIKELQKVQDNKQAVYFRGSNLDHKI